MTAPKPSPAPPPHALPKPAPLQRREFLSRTVQAAGVLGAAATGTVNAAASTPNSSNLAAASAAGSPNMALSKPSSTAFARPQPFTAPLRPRRLQTGDTLALVNPSGAIYERAPYELATESLQALGFKVIEAPHLRARYGQFAGTDAQRAADLNAMFADAQVHGILAVTGGSGANRILPLLDYALIQSHPKFFGGFSDITALLNAVHTQTGLVSFHGPMAASDWNSFSVEHWRGAVMQAQALTLRNPQDKDDVLVSKNNRITTLRGGKAEGNLLGGNLAVLSSLAGSPYFPSFDGAILFLEDVNEYIYRVDRMLSTLKLCGALDNLAGVVLGAFTNCEPGNGFGTLTLDEVFDDYFKALDVPVYRGALIGHIKRKFTVPVGLRAEMDADAGTLRFMQPAVL